MDGDIIDSKNNVFSQKEDPYGPLRQDFSRIFTENHLDSLTNANDIGFVDTVRSRNHRPDNSENLGFAEIDNPFMRISHKEDLSPNPKSLLHMGYSPATYLPTAHIGFSARDLFSGPGNKKTSESIGLTPSRALHRFGEDDYAHYDDNSMRYSRNPSDLIDNYISDYPLSLMWGHDATNRALKQKLGATPSDFFKQKTQAPFGSNFIPPVYRGNEFDEDEDLQKDDEIGEPDPFDQKEYQNSQAKAQQELEKLFLAKIEAPPTNSTMTTAQKSTITNPGSNQKAFRTPNKIKVKEEFKTTGKSTPGSKGRDDDDYGDDGDGLPGSEHRSSRGLRVLSVKVKDIVGEKKKTSYKEVADDLIAEFSNKLKLKKSGESKDEQNVKRRVYDALNVLIAADILKKDGKTVFCDESLANIGAPQRRKLREDRDIIEHNINDATRRKKKKLEVIRELISKCLAIKRLIQRNKAENVVGSPQDHQQLIVSEGQENPQDEKENKHINLDQLKQEQDAEDSKKIKKIKAKGKENEYEKDTLKSQEKLNDVTNALSPGRPLRKLTEDEIIRFPFIVLVSLSTENAMNLNMNSNQRHLSVQSKNNFDLFGDIDILLKMKLHHVSEEFFNENIPAEVQKYVIRAEEETQLS